ncbi:endolytic transglycosylase MltG [Merdibacter massiliensis]|uniref:endolytic transglycosylase MltG n=1 Tax=Merdibacter massiliensis TaxID=1871030 RepID=UPI00096A8FB7|nr:endolytic transglycosylase MltG [Merdibacter massiliensis]
MKKLSKQKKILLSIVAAVVVLIGIGYGFYLNELSAVNNKKQDVVFVVEEGETIGTVLDHLQEQGLIKSSTFANIHAKLTNLTQNKAGIFILNDKMSADEILRILNDPSQARTDQVLITFTEGRWAKDYAKQISEQLSIDENEILSLWNDTKYIEELAADYPFLDTDVLDNADYRVKLEGYLFPETYAFDKDATADEVTRTFLDHFSEIYDKYEEDIKKSDYSLQEILTLASIVQYESATSEDMKMIAGVFYNRLKEGMPLQSTVTVCYALYDDLDRNDEDSWKTCEASTDIDSPYNTYLHKGLPIGPIVNPGEAAIDAVLHPETNDYYYFIADIHGVRGEAGKVYYSKTYAEHKQLQEELNLVF